MINQDFEKIWNKAEDPEAKIEILLEAFFDDTAKRLIDRVLNQMKVDAIYYWQERL